VDEATAQAALLRNPAVGRAVQQAGEQALNDPKVQEAILRAAQEKGPEYAAIAQSKVKEWANDPEVQAKAKHYAGVALNMVGQAGSAFVGCIEQGPTGVRILAFCAGCGSMALSVLTLINPINMFRIFSYAISLYQALFSATTMLFEAKPEWIAKVGFLDDYVETLMRECKFLSLNGGRGLFYIFQGSLWLVLCDGLHEILLILVGLYLVFIGALHVSMHYGVMPDAIVAKVRGYRSLPAE